MISRRTIKFILARSGGLCENMIIDEAGTYRRCCSPSDFRGMEKHHVIHRSQGGGDEPENLMYVCAKCQSAQHGIKEV